MYPDTFTKNSKGMPRWEQSSMKCVALRAEGERRTPLLAIMPTLLVQSFLCIPVNVVGDIAER
jgi:hypothetical protein